MHEHFLDLREGRGHDTFHLVSQVMGGKHRHLRIDEHVQIAVDLGLGAPGAHGMDRPHAIHLLRHVGDVGGGNARVVGKSAQPRAEHAHCGGEDGHGHEQRHDGIGHGEPGHDEAEADDDADGDESVGERVSRISREDLALEPLARTALVQGHEQVHHEGSHHDDEGHWRHLSRVGAGDQLLHSRGAYFFEAAKRSSTPMASEP